MKKIIDVEFCCFVEGLYNENCFIFRNDKEEKEGIYVNVPDEVFNTTAYDVLKYIGLLPIDEFIYNGIGVIRLKDFIDMLNPRTRIRIDYYEGTAGDFNKYFYTCYEYFGADYVTYLSKVCSELVIYTEHPVCFTDRQDFLMHIAEKGMAMFWESETD